MTILQAIEDPKIFGHWLKGFDMTAWKSFHAAVHGLPMIEGQRVLYSKCTERTIAPVGQCREVFAGSGRRSGKSMNAAIEAIYMTAIDTTWQRHLAAGQRPIFAVFSVDRQSAKEIKNYCSGLLRSSPMLKRLIEKETQDEIYLSTSAIIQIKTASFRTSRGPAYVGAALDEVAFMMDLETSANPASEIIASVRPAVLPGGILFAISSVYNKAGVLWEQHQRHFGVEGDDVLFWLSDTMTMNPGFSKKKIDAEMAEDEPRAKAEYYSEWRDDLASLFSGDLIDGVTIPGRNTLPVCAGVTYAAACDMSGGRRDSSALAIAHRGGSGKVTVDFIQEVKAPHSPAEVVQEFSAILLAYGCHSVVGDRYGGEWPRDAFQKHGISYKISEQTASEAYLSLLPMFSNRSVELPDDQRLRAQLLSLMRRTSSGGRDSVIVGAGVSGHADMSNAAALVLVSFQKAIQGSAVGMASGDGFFSESNLGGLERYEMAIRGSQYDD